MIRLHRSLVVAALLAPALALAQTSTADFGVPPSLQVMRLAPQLVPFAGSQANFDSLVNGLALGSPVTLSSTLPNGQLQVVTFTPQGTMTPTQVAQTLEAARQNLISRGIATPNAQQMTVTLTGGVLPTQTGSVQVTGLLPAAAGASAAGGTSSVTTTTNPPNGNPSPSALMQGQSGAGGTTPPSPAAILQQQRGGNTSDTPTLGNTSNTPTGSATTPSAPAATTGLEPRATQQQAAPAREGSAPASPSAIGR